MKEIFMSSLTSQFNLLIELHRMGRHMEDCIIAAYVALLIGVLIDSQKVSFNS